MEVCTKIYASAVLDPEKTHRYPLDRRLRDTRYAPDVVEERKKSIPAGNHIPVLRSSRKYSSYPDSYPGTAL
jgi:hypothetical protein